MNPGRRTLLTASAALLLPRTASAQPHQAMSTINVEERSLAELQADMAAGRTSARQLVAAYTERIERIDRSGPRLASVIELNPDAPAVAQALDDELKAKGPRGPLHGLPILVKDNIATRDRMQTTAGSLALVGSQPPEDAAVVQRLRAGGAVILGKTKSAKPSSPCCSTNSRPI